ncbi:T9SS type A sorting domain-containing protein [Flexibacter flexilis]|nr:hypothetical protein [Flexibacter flexilis]
MRKITMLLLLCMAMAVSVYAQTSGTAIYGVVKDECENTYSAGTFYVKLFKQNPATLSYDFYSNLPSIGSNGQFTIAANSLPDGAFQYKIVASSTDEVASSLANNFFTVSVGSATMSSYDFNPFITILSHSVAAEYPYEYLVCDNGMFPAQITTNLTIPAWQAPVSSYTVTIQYSNNQQVNYYLTGPLPTTINFNQAPYNFTNEPGSNYLAYINFPNNCGFWNNGMAILRTSIKQADAPVFPLDQTCDFVELKTTGNAYYTGFQWYNDGVAINGATTEQYTATQSGHYTVACTTATGCIVTSAPYTVDLSPISATMTLSNTVACSSTPFAASATNVAGYSYAWTVTNANGTTSTYTGASPSLSFAGVGNAQVKLVITNTQGCTKEFTQTVNVLDCCGFDLSQFTVLGSAGTNTTYTSLPTSPTNKYLVAGDITLNLSGTTTLTSTEFRVVGVATQTPITGGDPSPIEISQPYGPAEKLNRSVTGSYITLASGTLVLEGCTLRAACNTMWGGIIVKGTGLLKTRSSTGKDNNPSTNAGTNAIIRDSYSGLVLKNGMLADICRTSFLNNLKSIQFAGTEGFRLYYGGNINNRTIKNNIFDSEQEFMLFPYNNAGFYTHTHIGNNDSVYVYTASTSFSSNLFRNALYGIRFTNHDYKIYYPSSDSKTFYYTDCVFQNNKIAAVWHTNGQIESAIAITDGYSYTTQYGVNIHIGNYGSCYLPTNYEGTIQIRAERQKIGMQSIVKGVGNEATLMDYGNVFGIYASNTTNYDYTDKFRSLTITGSSATQIEYGGEWTFRETGYYGHNMGCNFVINTTIAATDTGEYRGAHYFTNLRNGILLEGTKGSYVINNVVFTNNLTGIHINRTDASNVSLGIRCNDFVSTTSLARTGIRLQGNMKVNHDFINNVSTLGGCEDPSNNGVNIPNGNEVRNLRSHSNLVFPTNFTFINSSLASDIEYRRYKNENVQDVGSTSSVAGTSVSFPECSNLTATNSTCRTAAGILNRQAAPSSVQATLGNSAPNPAAYETQIGYTLPEEAVGKAQIVVYAPVSGKAVFTQTLQETEGNVTVNLSRLASGIYPYVLLLDGKVVQSRKLAVIK